MDPLPQGPLSNGILQFLLFKASFFFKRSRSGLDAGQGPWTSVLCLNLYCHNHSSLQRSGGTEGSALPALTASSSLGHACRECGVLIAGLSHLQWGGPGPGLARRGIPFCRAFSVAQALCVFFCCVAAQWLPLQPIIVD